MVTICKKNGEMVDQGQDIENGQDASFLLQ